MLGVSFGGKSVRAQFHRADALNQSCHHGGRRLGDRVRACSLADCRGSAKARRGTSGARAASIRAAFLMAETGLCGTLRAMNRADCPFCQPLPNERILAVQGLSGQRAAKGDDGSRRRKAFRMVSLHFGLLARGGFAQQTHRFWQQWVGGWVPHKPEPFSPPGFGSYTVASLEVGL